MLKFLLALALCLLTMQVLSGKGAIANDEAADNTTSPLCDYDGAEYDDDDIKDNEIITCKDKNGDSVNFYVLDTEFVCLAYRFRQQGKVRRGELQPSDAYQREKDGKIILGARFKDVEARLLFTMEAVAEAESVDDVKPDQFKTTVTVQGYAKEGEAVIQPIQVFDSCKEGRLYRQI